MLDTFRLLVVHHHSRTVIFINFVLEQNIFVFLLSPSVVLINCHYGVFFLAIQLHLLSSILLLQILFIIIV